MTYTLRKPTEEDIPRIVELDRLVADHLHGLDPYWRKGKDIGDEADIREQVKKALVSPDESWLVAEVDRKIVGFFSAEIMKTVPVFKNKEIGLISDAFLLESFRGQGIAKAAISRFIEWFKEKGVRSAELLAASHNTDAVRAWEGLGFKEYLKKMKMDL